jgi:hypothetical protein
LSANSILCSIGSLFFHGIAGSSYQLTARKVLPMY